MSLLVGAAEWIRSQGINQWGHYLDGSGRADLAEAIQNGDVYLCSVDGRPAGTISLHLTPSDWDRQIWGAAADDGAVYIHRFAVAWAFAGTGLGARLLGWAEGQARAKEKRYLRLDCVAGNQALNAYYAKRFQPRAQAANIGMEFRQYEKVLD